MQVFVSIYVGSSGVVWKNSGESITIQCRFPQTYKAEREFLHLKMGLSEDSVLVKEKSSGKISIGKQFTGRIQLNGLLPNMDFLIKNLTSDDIGPYWCEHKWYNAKAIKQEITKGTGSVLLVVTGKPHQFLYYLTTFSPYNSTSSSFHWMHCYSSLLM